jgi:hypothetical protein
MQSVTERLFARKGDDMYETVVTNGAAITALVVLYGLQVWVVTYLYMAEKVRKQKKVIETLDYYIEMCETDLDAPIDYVLTGRGY